MEMGIKVLSLFDGMSCGQQALNNLGIDIDIYLSSEIDKYAIQVTQANFPNTIQVGDVTKVNYEIRNDKVDGITGVLNYKVGNINGGLNVFRNIKKFDLLLGGNPCQGFSFAGKQLNFEDERSKLFFEYVRILKEVKPKYFLLENVKMKKEYQDVISEHLFGIKPIEINSALLTAQNRKRLYWVGELQENGTYKQVNIKQPQDKGVLLKDILENEVDDKFYLNETQINKIINSNFMQEKLRIQKGDKCGILLARDYKDTKCIINRPHGYFKGSIHTEKSPTIRSQVEGNILKQEENRIRKLTPLECERLQGVKPGYTSCVSNSQRYKMLGNGWTIPIIEWILSHILKHIV